jgi:hypothetical protein
MAVTITATTRRKRLSYGEAIELEVRVKNGGPRRVFVVTEPYVWSSSRTRLNVLLAEATPSPGFCYYDYSPPRRRMVRPGQETLIRVKVGMPPRKGDFDAQGRYIWKATPVAGSVSLEVTVGYLENSFRPRTSAPWAEFLEQQTLTTPKRIKLRIANR